MVLNLISRVFGTKHERDIRRMWPLVEEINGHFGPLRELTDEALRQKTADFRARLEAGETEEDLLPEAFAVVKETCRRLVGQTWDVCGIPITWDMVPFDVQLLGAIVLHEGKIAEMATGEGKTLVATMPIYLNALSGKGVHLVTVNDYLARRDSEWMGRIYTFLGLTVGCIQNGMDFAERNAAYACDITYGTNNEFGFDYLRDNMARHREHRVQRGHHYAIIDEVDSVLIDEARTPLIISGPVEHSIQKYDEMKPDVERLVRTQGQLVNRILADAEVLRQDPGREWDAGFKLLQVKRGAPKNKRFAKLVSDEPGMKRLIQKVELELIRDKRMGEADEELYYSIDERNHSIDLSEQGRELLSQRDRNLFLLPDLATELSAIDEDDALEPADKVAKKRDLERIHAERSERVHNILQLLRAYSLYEKDVEYVVQEEKILIVDEFTGRLMPGRRYSDGLHQAIEAKENVRVEGETQTLATITIQNYFRLYVKLAGMTGTAETEAQEVWHTYKRDVVVVPTNMAGRGTDIKLETGVIRCGRDCFRGSVSKLEHGTWHQVKYCKEEVPCGLHILGTERHESRRIDRQLRGRAGRQGDPGSSRFYLSLEDDLMRLFGSERIAGIMERLGVQG